MKQSCLLGLVLLAASPATFAQVALDQQQAGMDSGAAIGPSEQTLAQTFRAGRDGRLSHVSMPIACYGGASYTLTVALETVTAAGLPSGVVLDSITVDSSAVAARPERHSSAFPLEAALVAGQRYAIVARSNPEADCELYGTTDASAYPAGEAFFHALPNPPGWRPASLVADFAFATYLEADVAVCAFRTAYGEDNDWVPADVPVCGCLQDPGLAYERCWFHLPELLLVREIPLWPKEDFVIRWSVLPLVDDPLPVEIELHSLSGKLVGDPLKLEAGKPLQAFPVEEVYWAEGAAALDATQVMVRDAHGTIEFETRREDFQK